MTMTRTIRIVGADTHDHASKRAGLPDSAQLLRVRPVPLLKSNERHAFQRTEVSGGESQHDVPFVERALQLVAIDGDARQQVVRIYVMRMPLEAAHSNLEREIELPLPAQCFAEGKKDEARRIARELVAPATNVVSHGQPPRALPERA